MTRLSVLGWGSRTCGGSREELIVKPGPGVDSWVYQRPRATSGGLAAPLGSPGDSIGCGSLETGLRCLAAPMPSVVEQLKQRIRRARDYRAIAADDDRSLHELRVLEKYGHDLIDGRVVVFVQLESLEVLVLPNEVGRRIGKQSKETLEVCLLERIVQVFDGVELDAALAQDLDCATRLASAGVVVDGDAVHEGPLFFAQWRSQA